MHADHLAVALRLADAADEITTSRFPANDLVVSRKTDRSPVTDADTAVEDTVREILDELRPDDAVLGEERGGAIGVGRTWVLDPIDGTKNFLRGNPVWATLIALVDGGAPVVGVVSSPAMPRRWRVRRLSGGRAAVAGLGGGLARGRLPVHDGPRGLGDLPDSGGLPGARRLLLGDARVRGLLAARARRRGVARPGRGAHRQPL